MSSSERLRAAYWVFLKDVFIKPRGQVDSDTQTWWSGLQQLSVTGEQQKNKTSNHENLENSSSTSSIQIDLKSGTVTFDSSK